MKTIALLCSCLMISGCGNWSNKDLEFLNAMPTKEQLRSKLPTGTAGALAGEGTRRDALAIGERSQRYTDSKDASDKFNGILTFLVGALDLIRSYPPTSRTDESRTWGPWADKDNPGFEFRAVITKVDDKNFTYAFQHRPKDGEFFDTVTGSFKASESLRKGSGALIIHAADAVAHQLKTAKALELLEKIEVSYVTDMFPVTVVMKFTVKPGQVLQSLDYGYQENEDKSGGMSFTSKSTDPNISRLDVGTAWLASGAGFGVLTVTEGAMGYKGATQFECWDAAFNTTYVKQTWPPFLELGDSKSCVSVDNFPRP